MKKNNKKVLAICKKTYVDEDDMIHYANGELKCPSKVKIYYKGGEYLVVKKSYNKKFYKLIKEK